MPKRVAVIGASSDARKFGNRAVRTFLRRGYEVLPVNPNETTIEGLPAWRSVGGDSRNPRHGDLLRAAGVGLGLLDEVAAAQPDEVWFNPGSEDDRSSHGLASSDCVRSSRAASSAPASPAWED